MHSADYTDVNRKLCANKRNGSMCKNILRKAIDKCGNLCYNFIMEQLWTVKTDKERIFYDRKC